MKKKILIIEDDPDLVDLLSYRLKAKGYEVLTALDGATGLEVAKNEKPDLITLDVMMPGLNGFTVCRALKFNDEYKHIPIIFLTAKSGATDNVFDESVQPEAYITKPFDINHLFDKIEELL